MHNLMGHMHLHSDSKPFKCLYCPSKFTLKGNLTRHMKVKHGVMDRGLDDRREDAFRHRRCPVQHVSHHLSSFLPPLVFRQRGRFCLPNDVLTHFSQEEPFDLSQKPPGLPGHRLSQSDGESIPGSSCQEEDEDSLYRRSPYSPEVDQHDQQETEKASAVQWRGGDLKQPRRDERTYERESETDEETTGDKVHLLQRQEMLSKSGSQAGNQVYRRQSNGDDSDSEPENHHVINEPERCKPQPGEVCEEGERNGRRVGFTVIKAPHNKDQE